MATPQPIIGRTLGHYQIGNHPSTIEREYCGFL
jgi:hypothetical protein